MRIVIDARMLFWTGVGRYTKALLNELEAIDTENEYIVIIRRADRQLWSPQAENFAIIECNIDPYTFAEQWKLYWLIRRLKPDLVHFTAPNTPLLFQGVRVVTIHDLTLLDFNTSRGRGLVKLLKGAKRLPFRLVLLNDARFATGLITATDFVHDQLIERLGSPSRRVFTTLLATDTNIAKPEPIDRLGELGTYAFYIGNMYPYKNIQSTILALASMSRNHSDLNLVIAGRRDAFSEELEVQARDLGVGERVKFVGYVSDGEMVSLYQGAAVYVNPSLSEGFGLQGLEAMAQSVPVVAARASCLPEVYGNAAEYFDPYDTRSQAAAIALILDDKSVAERLRRAGRIRTKQFSWRRMAEQTLETYHQVRS